MSLPSPPQDPQGADPEERLQLLRGWLRQADPPGKDGLMPLVLRVVDELSWLEKGAAFPSNHPQAVPAQFLLILAVYSYARGIYESSEIELLILQNAELGILFQESHPHAKVIRQFRQTHHRLIRESLLNIFDLAFRVRFGEPGSELAPVDGCVIEALDRWFEPICGPHPDLEADHRLGKASFWDDMADAC